MVSIRVVLDNARATLLHSIRKVENVGDADLVLLGCKPYHFLRAVPLAHQKQAGYRDTGPIGKFLQAADGFCAINPACHSRGSFVLLLA